MKMNNLGLWLLVLMSVWQVMLTVSIAFML